MKTRILWTSALLLLAQPLPADELPIMVEESGSKEVDSLVAQLVARQPSPFPPSGAIPEHFKDIVQLPMMGNYITKEVAEAITELEQLGPSASPYLLFHLRDHRYSYSATLPSAIGRYSGWIDRTVGMVVRDIITGGFESGWLYKVRDGSDNASFLPPKFYDYLETQGGLERWVAENSKNSKAKVFSKFIDWCIVTERGRGFQTKDDELRLIARYEAWKQKVEDIVPNP